MTLIVQKFGGTSVADTEKILAAARKAIRAQQEGKQNNDVVKKNKTIVTLTSITASPNPFNIRTNIRFQSSKNQLVEFSVKNLLGKKIYSEHIEVEIGSNNIIFDKNELIKGMYIYTLQSGTEVASKRLVIQ